MQRRAFLQTSAATLPLALSNVPVGVPRSPLFEALTADPSDRVLVLIQLNGGNDGLNSFVPLDAYDDLAAVRGNILPRQSDLLHVESRLAFHPKLAGFRDVWESGRMAAVQNVGYPDQNRSHFRSTDIWNTASPADEVYDTGWLGRHFDRVYPGFPAGFPNREARDPAAITVGNGVTETCQGLAGNFAITVKDPLNQGSILEVDGGEEAGGIYGDELAFVRTAISQSNAYGQVIREAAERGDSVADYPDDVFGRQLSYVARMISGGLRTKVYVVTLGGFDTHASQVIPGDPTAGEHAERLRRLGEGVAAFQDDLRALGISDRVIGMTYSEFGRRIRSNAAYGTDHGTAAPAFLFGDCIAAGTTGDNPEVDRAVDEQEGVAMQYDFRDLYGTVLEDWFGLDDRTIRGLLHEEYARLPGVIACSARPDGPTSTTDPDDGATGLSASPTAFREAVRLTFTTTQAGRVRLSAFDVAGRLVETLFSRRLPPATQTVTVDTREYPHGVVVFRLQQGSRVRTVRTIRR